MRRGVRTATAVIVLAVVGPIGCSDEEGPVTEIPTAEDADADPVAAAESRVLIDVRTPEEVAAGALEGALHLDVQDPDFDARVAELPRDEAYLVYCRSGNRSAQAIERMRALGFDDLVDGGAFEDLAAAGLPTTP